MRHVLLSLLLIGAGFASKAQVYADFEDLTLPSTDTYYVNYSMPGMDVGFSNGEEYLPCVYDTAFGFSYWSSGFAYSNMTDTLTPGYTNGYSSIAGKGYDTSAQYAVAYGVDNYIKNNFPGDGIESLFITNNTYAYLSMRDGDAFAKKFGGISGNDPDYFRLIIHGYDFSGALVPDSVVFYLADFRDADSANDYIVKDWQEIDLTSNLFFYADSLTFHLESSDTNMFGMNTPAYFCIDHIVSNARSGVHDQNLLAKKIHLSPVPSASFVNIEMDLPQLKAYEVVNAIGQVYQNGMIPAQNFSLDISRWPAGQYFIRFYGNGEQAVKTIVRVGN